MASCRPRGALMVAFAPPVALKRVFIERLLLAQGRSRSLKVLTLKVLRYISYVIFGYI